MLEQYVGTWQHMAPVLAKSATCEHPITLSIHMRPMPKRVKLTLDMKTSILHFLLPLHKVRQVSREFNKVWLQWEELVVSGPEKQLLAVEPIYVQQSWQQAKDIMLKL